MASRNCRKILTIALLSIIVGGPGHNAHCEDNPGKGDDPTNPEAGFEILIFRFLETYAGQMLKDIKGNSAPRPRKQYSEKERKTQEKKQEDFLYGLLKKEGRIAHPDYSYEFYVKKVQGRKLLDIEFMRRDPSGKSYDLVGRASEAELHVDLKEGQIVVEVRRLRVVGKEFSFRCEEKCLPMALPGIPFRNRPKDIWVKQPSWLTAEDKKYVAEEFVEPQESNADKKLVQAFGEGCREVNRAVKLDLTGRGLLLAFDKFEPEADGRVTFSMAKFRRPNKNGDTKPIIAIRSEFARLTLDRGISSVLELGNRKILRIELADGTRLTMDGPEK